MKFIKSKKFYLLLVLLLALGSFGYARYGQKPTVKYSTSKVESGTLKQTVSETGVIKHASEVNLNFLAQGRIATSAVKVGSKVKKGQLLAELDYSNQKILSRQAEANLEVAKANERKILSGATIQDINIGQTAVDQAVVNLANAKKDLAKASESDVEAVAQAKKNYDDLMSKSVNTPAEASVNSAQVSLDNNKLTYRKTITNRSESLLVAIHDKISVSKNALDNVNRILSDEDAKETLSVGDTVRLEIAKNDYSSALNYDKSCSQAYQKAAQTKTTDDIKTASDCVTDYLKKSIIALNDTFDVLEKSITSTKFTQAELDSFKSTVSSQISLANAGLSALEQNKQALDDAIMNYNSVIASSEENLNVAMANLTSAQTQALNSLNNAKLAQTRNLQSGTSRVESAQEALKLAQAQLGKTTASTRPEDISLVQAQVKQAKANLDSVLNQISNSIIKAPFDGTITQANYEVGEEPNAAKPVFVLMGENQFEIEVDIAESDIAKVSLGNPVDIDFDAFGQGIKFYGKVDALDPAQTVIQEVVYYKGTIRDIKTATATEEYLRQIKPGMTANITIMANKKDNVLIIPFRAVTDKSGIRTIKVLENNQPIERNVSLGMRGDDGLVEIISGLSAGEEVIISTQTN